MKRQVAPYGFAVLAALLVVEMGQGMVGPLDTQLIWSSTRLALAASDVLVILCCLVLMVCLGEGLDRNRRRLFNDLVHATTLPTAALLLGPLLSGLVVVSIMVAASTLTAFLMIRTQGLSAIELWPFLWFWWILPMPGFLLSASIILATYAMTRSRAATYAIGLLFLMTTVALHLRGGLSWVLNWPLWSVLTATDFGSGANLPDVLIHNRSLTLAVAGLLFCVAVWRYRRTEVDTKTSIRIPGQTFWWVTTLASVSILWPAFEILRRIESGPDGQKAQTLAQAYWRQNSAFARDMPHPRIVHLTLDLRIEPDAGTMSASGTYDIQSDHGGTDVVWPFTVGPGFRNVRWQIDGDGLIPEDRSGLHLLRPPSSNKPTRRLFFQFEAKVPSGIRRHGLAHRNFIRSEGVLLDSLGTDLMPLPGVVSSVGLTRHNAQDAKPLTEAQARGQSAIGFQHAWTSVVTIDAPDAYDVNSVGDLELVSNEKGRRIVRFNNNVPVRALTVVAGRWSVAAGDGVATYFTAAHNGSVPEMLNALMAARRRFGEWYAPYPWQELRVNEIPAFNTRAQGFPGNLNLSEDMGFISIPDAALPVPTIIVAHEAAHQWWGNLVTPGAAPGADVLIESMANHATLSLLAAEHGDTARQHYARFLEDRYMDRRQAASELPLSAIIDTDAASDETVIYDRGAWVMWMLSQQLGSEAWQSALHSYFEQFRISSEHPLLADFLRILRHQSADAAAFDEFVSQWIHGSGLPEFRIDDVQLNQLDSDWRLDATVANIGSVGVSVAVSVEPVTGHRAEAQIASIPAKGAQRLSWLLPDRPKQLVIDPEIQVLQKNRRLAQHQISPE
ncbi:MAG: hypothetical protein IPK97_05705 [Ahniella sp.]|nr:hypothetical protein [Ahniella sp.]